MDVIVYVETNFLMSVAMEREARGDDLLAAVSASVRIAIPSGCYMESFSAFESEKGRRNWFRDELEKQIKQLRRDTTSPNADTLLARLEESRIANYELVNDIQDRLFRFVDRADDQLRFVAAHSVADLKNDEPSDLLPRHIGRDIGLSGNVDPYSYRGTLRRCDAWQMNGHRCSSRQIGLSVVYMKDARGQRSEAGGWHIPGKRLLLVQRQVARGGSDELGQRAEGLVPAV